MRGGGKAPPKDRPALEHFVRGEVRRCDDKNGAEERAGSHQALRVGEQIIKEAVPQRDKSLIFRRPVGADFKGADKAEGVFNLRHRVAVAEKAGENQDPWPLVDQMFSNPAKTLPKDLAAGIGETLCKKWQRLPAERKALLKLISRFEIEPDQAKLAYVLEERVDAAIDCTDAQLLSDPYLFFESTRLSADPISVWTVDRGVFPDEIVRKEHQLPKPSALDAGTDARRDRGRSNRKQLWIRNIQFLELNLVESMDR
jgi:hypothetical protein